MAAAAAKNIAKKFASYAHANPRLNKESNAIMVSSRKLAYVAFSKDARKILTVHHEYRPYILIVHCSDRISYGA